MSHEIRALLLARYSPQAASSRYRFFEMAPELESAGIRCTVAPLFDEHYLSHRFRRPSSLAGSTLRAYRRRWRDLRGLGGYDVAFVQMELFPYAPWWLERRAMVSDVAWVVDYDDAWFHRYGDHPNPVVRAALKDKIAAVMRRATSVVVGSRYLQDYASQVNANVVWAPTAIDLSRYPRQQPAESDAPFTIGWIGSPGTTEFLMPVAATLSEFCATRNARVVLMGAGDNAPTGSCFSRVAWSSETEVNEMSRWDVGIMPLVDSPFARGKCAFKLIQYMGCWKPVIASPVGENTRVVEHGVTGFLAHSPSEWMTALTELYVGRARGLRMGVAGRAVVERHYSREVVAPRVAECLKAAVRRPRRPVS